MIKLTAALALLSSLIPLPALAGDVTGVYVGSASNEVTLVQIVRTPDGRLAGRIEEVSLDATGSIADQSNNIEGAADGNQITFSVKSLLFPGSSPGATGFVSGDQLDLSWQGGHMILKRGDAYTFQEAVTGLKARAAKIISSRKAGEAAQSAEIMTATIASLKSAVPSIEEQLTSAEAQYVDLYKGIYRQRRQQKLLEGLPDQGVDAMRAGTDAQGLMVKINGVHLQVNELGRDVTSKINDARRRIAELHAACPSPNSQLANVCSQLASNENELEGLSRELGAKFAAAEDAYQHPAPDVPPGRRLIQNLFGGR